MPSHRFCLLSWGLDSCPKRQDWTCSKVAKKLKIYIPTVLGLMKLRDWRRSRCYHKLLGENYIRYNNRTNFKDSFDLIIELSRR